MSLWCLTLFYLLIQVVSLELQLFDFTIFKQLVLLWLIFIVSKKYQRLFALLLNPFTDEFRTWWLHFSLFSEVIRSFSMWTIEHLPSLVSSGRCFWWRCSWRIHVVLRLVRTHFRYFPVASVSLMVQILWPSIWSFALFEQRIILRFIDVLSGCLHALRSWWLWHIVIDFTLQSYRNTNSYKHLLKVALREAVCILADLVDQGLDHVLLDVVSQHLLLQTG